MVITTLGETGLVVSRIGLGLAALGRPGYINIGHAEDLGRGRDVPAMEAGAHAVLDAAWDAGVRYFDAARSYGRAEEFLARWLAARGIDPAGVTVGSKWGYTYTAGWRVEAEKHEVKDHSLANLRRQAAESRAILGAHLDLYQIHSATLDSGVLDDPAVLGELARLRGEGLRIGLSLSGPRQAEALRRALEVVVDGVRPFDAVQATWNPPEPSAGPALAEARAAGLGVIVKEALANGRLTARNDAPAFTPRRRLLEGWVVLPARDHTGCPGPGRRTGPPLGRRGAERGGHAGTTRLEPGRPGGGMGRRDRRGARSARRGAGRVLGHPVPAAVELSASGRVGAPAQPGR